jgi:hypothetical protein
MRRIAIIAGALCTMLGLGGAANGQVVSLLVGNESGFAGLDRYETPTGAYAGSFATGSGSGTLAQFSFFRYGPDGNLFVGQGTNVLKYNGLTGQFISTFTSVLGAQFTFGPNGNMYRIEPMSQAQPNPRQIGLYDGTTGVRLSTFVPSAVSGLSNSFGNMRFGPDGNLYVDDGNRLLRFNGATGAPMGEFIPPGTGGLVTVADFLFTSNNALLISATVDSILSFNANTGAFNGVFASGNGLNIPFGLDEGSDGNLYVASLFSRQVKRFNIATGAFVDDWIPMTAGNRPPSYIEFTPFAVPEPSSPLLGLVMGVPYLVRSLRRRMGCKLNVDTHN